MNILKTGRTIRSDPAFRDFARVVPIPTIWLHAFKRSFGIRSPVDSPAPERIDEALRG